MLSWQALAGVAKGLASLFIPVPVLSFLSADSTSFDPKLIFLFLLEDRLGTTGFSLMDSMDLAIALGGRVVAVESDDAKEACSPNDLLRFMLDTFRFFLVVRHWSDSLREIADSKEALDLSFLLFVLLDRLGTSSTGESIICFALEVINIELDVAMEDSSLKSKVEELCSASDLLLLKLEIFLSATIESD